MLQEQNVLETVVAKRVGLNMAHKNVCQLPSVLFITYSDIIVLKTEVDFFEYEMIALQLLRFEIITKNLKTNTIRKDFFAS